MYGLTALTLCFKLKVFFYINTLFTLIFAVLLRKQNRKYYSIIRSFRPLGGNRVGAFNGATLNLWEPRCCFKVYNFIRSRDIKGIPIFNNRSHDLVHASTWPNFLHFCIVPLVAIMHHIWSLQVQRFDRCSRGTKVIKVGHVTYATPLLTYFYIFWFVGLPINLHTKFEVFSFILSRDIDCIQKFKNRSRYLVHAPTWPNFLHLLPVHLVFNLHTIFEVSNFTRSREIEGVPQL